MTEALNHLYPFVHELFVETETERAMKEAGIGPDLPAIESSCTKHYESIITEADLSVPETKPRVVKGKDGIHSENLGYILTEFQYMQRAYPNMEW